MRARPVTFPQRPLEEGKSLEAPQSVQDRFQGVSPRSDSTFGFRQGRQKKGKRGLPWAQPGSEARAGTPSSLAFLARFARQLAPP